jgi:tetratricopeptide (TPR) repeat protein
MGKAIADLEPIVAKEPTYKDSLTLLARAYYNQARYKDAYEMLRFALGVNKEDEIAWTALGMTQIRLGEDEKGIETLKGAITLVSRVSKSGYRDYKDWDNKGLIRSTISRTAFLLQKGLEEKDNILRACETLLARMDEEEHYWIIAAPQQRRYNY